MDGELIQEIEELLESITDDIEEEINTTNGDKIDD
jgi:hypothetical protein